MPETRKSARLAGRKTEVDEPEAPVQAPKASTRKPRKAAARGNDPPLSNAANWLNHSSDAIQEARIKAQNFVSGYISSLPGLWTDPRKTRFLPFPLQLSSRPKPHAFKSSQRRFLRFLKPKNALNPKDPPHPPRFPKLRRNVDLEKPSVRVTRTSLKSLRRKLFKNNQVVRSPPNALCQPQAGCRCYLEICLFEKVLVSSKGLNCF